VSPSGPRNTPVSTLWRSSRDRGCDKSGNSRWRRRAPAGPVPFGRKGKDPDGRRAKSTPPGLRRSHSAAVLPALVEIAGKRSANVKGPHQRRANASPVARLQLGRFGPAHHTPSEDLARPGAASLFLPWVGPSAEVFELRIPNPDSEILWSSASFPEKSPIVCDLERSIGRIATLALSIRNRQCQIV